MRASGATGGWVEKWNCECVHKLESLVWRKTSEPLPPVLKRSHLLKLLIKYNVLRLYGRVRPVMLILDPMRQDCAHRAIQRIVCGSERILVKNGN